ncbi:MAG: ester cyclase [Gammaproteobacteria bacterium]|nr:ester cyclase [Gammaproteobacteria bacterium]
MSTESNKALIRRYGEEHYNRWNELLIEELIHPEVTGEFPGFDPQGGREAYRSWYRGLKGAFPDCHFEIDWLVADEDMVAVRWDYRATHSGMFMGLPATGRRIEMKYNSMYRILSGKIIDIRSDTDTLKLVQQLGFYLTP